MGWLTSATVIVSLQVCSVAGWQSAPLRPSFGLERRAARVLRSSQTDLDADEEAQMLREAEKIAKKKRSNMFNENGVPYAPWMVRQVDEEAITVARALRAERKRKEQRAVMEAQGVVNILEAATSELSGMGLKAKVIDESEVELVWGTDSEDGNLGFIIEKKRIGGSEWQQIASFKDWSPLKSKGELGGAYSYVDVDADQGEFLYRIISQQTDGTRAITCQVGVTVESTGQQLQTKIVVGVSAILFASFLYLGAALDPIKG